MKKIIYSGCLTQACFRGIMMRHRWRKPLPKQLPLLQMWWQRQPLFFGTADGTMLSWVDLNGELGNDAPLVDQPLPISVLLGANLIRLP